MGKNITITGATSRLGRALAVKMHKRGHTVGATGRRTDRLKAFSSTLEKRIYTNSMDVSKPEERLQKLVSLIQEMDGMDIIILNAGVSNFQGNMDWKTERNVIDVNVRGFSALANYAFDYFEQQHKGHIVGVSSVAGLFGYRLSSSYNAFKAYVSNYLQGYRQRANHLTADITITDLQPGFVESEITEGKKGMFWAADTGKAVRQMANAVARKRDHAYIIRRWRPGLLN